MRLAAVALALILLGGCSESEKDQSGLACDHFRNVAGDIRDGVLTDSEIRKKFQEIDSNASIATPAVQNAARGMLSAITTGTIQDVFQAMSEMDAACDTAGH